MRISDWSSDVCSSDLLVLLGPAVDLAAEIIAGLAVIGQPRRLDVDAVQRGERVDHRKIGRAAIRSEEHTSELQSLMRISYAVFCLKKKKHKNKTTYKQHT